MSPRSCCGVLGDFTSTSSATPLVFAATAFFETGRLPMLKRPAAIALQHHEPDVCQCPFKSPPAFFVA